MTRVRRRVIEDVTRPANFAYYLTFEQNITKSRARTARSRIAYPLRRRATSVNDTIYAEPISSIFTVPERRGKGILEFLPTEYLRN